MTLAISVDSHLGNVPVKYELRKSKGLAGDSI